MAEWRDGEGEKWKGSLEKWCSDIFSGFTSENISLLPFTFVFLSFSRCMLLTGTTRKVWEVNVLQGRLGKYLKKTLCPCPLSTEVRKLWERSLNWAECKFCSFGLRRSLTCSDTWKVSKTSSLDQRNVKSHGREECGRCFACIWRMYATILLPLNLPALPTRCV